MRILTLFFGLISFSLIGQITYNVSEIQKVSVSAIADPQAEVDDYFPQFLYKEAPRPDGSGYDKLKAKVAERFPRKESTAVTPRGVLDPPVIALSYNPNGSLESTPPDNSFGVDADGQNISAVNSHFVFSQEDGSWLRKRSLTAFSQGIASGMGKFDPRIVYDPEEDRFVMLWLAGGPQSTSSTCILAFSTSSNIMDPWSLYEIEGNPFGDQWSDYPMISLSNNELLFTINLIKKDVSWEAGFDGTLIYQIDKIKAYNEGELEFRMWSDIRHNGRLIRNLHPVKAAGEELYKETFFLSNRNFDLENDSIFILNINSDMNDPDLALDIDVRKADVAYGAPPNGIQGNPNTLATNDARILDGFRTGDMIRFAGNTVVPATGKAGIYYGKITDLGGNKEVTGEILTHDTRDFGYPGISWTGKSSGEDEAIIVSQYVSETEFPGIQAMYTAGDEYSDWVILQEGKAWVDLLNSDAERWGDYTGAQRKNDVPGQVWTSSSTTDEFGSWDVNVSVLNSSIESNTEELLADRERLAVYPNPTSERVSVEMEIRSKDRLQLSLYDLQRRLMETFFDDGPKKLGTLKFSFDLQPLASGTYVFIATQQGKEIKTQRVIKN